MIKKVELDLGGGRVLSLETGLLAREAGGAVVVRLGDTVVLATATASSSQRPGIDFFPLLVDYEEKLYAAGRIPGGFFKREGRPTQTAILTSRLIDRPIRPLFPDGFRNDVQIVLTPLSVDFNNPPDILAMIGASAALSIAGLPLDGPVGSVRIAKVGDEFIAMPDTEQMEKSDLDLIVAGTKDGVMMIEAGANEVSEEVFQKAIEVAHEKIKEIVKFQEKLVKEVGKPKRTFDVYQPDTKIEKLIKDLSTDKIKKALNINDKDKQKSEFDKIKEEAVKKIKESKDQELIAKVEKSTADVSAVIKKIQKGFVRKMIVDESRRPDGRKIDQIRPLDCQVGVIPRAHGVGLFSRGQTQVMTVVTLGSAGEGQRIEGLDEEETKKRYLHHYNFPAYSVGEVRPLRGPGRREIGHGALAERALIPVLPDEEKFAYTIRLVSEVLGSNGSTSMASTCASTLSLMDAGVPITKPVAGISIGLVKEGNKAVTLTDIQGLEDFLGDMDFKVAGTKDGITAIQLDMKINGIDHDIIAKTFKQAKVARMEILKKMAEAIDTPRKELSEFAPRIITMKINPAKIGIVIGPGGKMIKKIVEETGVKIDLDDDGTVYITSSDAEASKRAQQIVDDLTREAKIGEVFNGKVVRLMNFGAFVEYLPGKDGLVHISHLAQQRVNKVEDVVKIGDAVVVKIVEVDEKGRVNLSMKAVTAEDRKKLEA